MLTLSIGDTGKAVLGAIYIEYWGKHLELVTIFIIFKCTYDVVFEKTIDALHIVLHALLFSLMQFLVLINFLKNQIIR